MDVLDPWEQLVEELWGMVCTKLSTRENAAWLDEGGEA